MNEQVMQEVAETNEELKETYIKALPKKIAELRFLKEVTSKIKSVEKEIDTMVTHIGPYQNEMFEINLKITKEVKINYTTLQSAMKEIEQTIPNCEDKGKIELLKNLQESIKKDIEVKKPAEKLKLLMALNPEKAKEVKTEVIKQRLELKEKKAFEEYYEEQNKPTIKGMN